LKAILLPHRRCTDVNDARLTRATSVRSHNRSFWGKFEGTLWSFCCETKLCWWDLGLWPKRFWPSCTLPQCYCTPSGWALISFVEPILNFFGLIFCFWLLVD
jgi:hypothetical protein